MAGSLIEAAKICGMSVQDERTTVSTGLRNREHEGFNMVYPPELLIICNNYINND